MLVAKIIATAAHTLTLLGHPGACAVPIYASSMRRIGSVMAQLSWDCAPELLVLKDILMETSVKHQIENFRNLNDGGHVMWLSSAWESFSVDASSICTLDAAPGAAPAVHVPGRLEHFIDKLMHSGHEYVFVKMRSPRQGTGSNPYLQQIAYRGYLIKVEPANVAQRLMACREDLAAEWHKDLMGLASCCDTEHLPHTQRLVRLATGAALRCMLNDLARVPTQAAVHDYLESFVVFHTEALGLGGDPCALLVELGRRPLCVSGKSLIDPSQIEANLRLMRQGITAAMADSLASTVDTHRDAEIRFLDACVCNMTIYPPA